MPATNIPTTGANSIFISNSILNQVYREIRKTICKKKKN